MQRDEDSPGRKLWNHYHSCANWEKPAPTLAEIVALEASKEQLIYAVRDCARSICWATNLSKKKNKDVETAESLLQKWTSCYGLPYNELTPHMIGIVEQRTKEEVEDMTRDAFADMDELLENAKGEEQGFPIL